MNSLKEDRSTLKELIEKEEVTSGMYVEVRGDRMTLGREEKAGWPPGQTEQTEKVDRIRLEPAENNQYRISVKRHTGRWEKTPYKCGLQEVVEVLTGPMQHLVAEWP